MRKPCRKSTSLDNEEGEVRIGPFPLVKEIPLESGDPPDQPSNTPEHTPQVMDTPYFRPCLLHLLSTQITQVPTRTTDHQNGTHNDSC
jgi:hypothetical protein